VLDSTNAPLAGASIREKGTNNGASAGNDGSFKITVKQGARLIISAIGYSQQELAAASTVTVALRSNAGNLNDVVVTALGIRRRSEEIGYSTATVRPEQITNGKPLNLAQALSGKVAGLTINNTSASINASPRVVLRGLRSVTGDNTSLIVLDGVAVPSNSINYINPNDVERIDILKGGQAATLFGSDGVNGAIVITTKKGSQRPEISFQHSSNIEKVAYLPETQHGFGSGSAYGSNRSENFNPAENQQFGDAYDGSIRPLGRTLADGSVQLLPYSDNPNARKDFWNTGYTAKSDLSYRAGDQTSNFFTSFQNVVTNGIVPKDKKNTNSFRLNAGKTYGKVNLSFDATYTWDNIDATNSDFYFFSLNTPSWAPVAQLRDWQSNKFADPSGYFNDYYNNPWWQLDNVRYKTKDQYFNGNIKMTYKASSALDFTARFALANTNTNTSTISNAYTYTGFSQTGAYVSYFNNNYDRFLTGVGRTVTRTPVNGGIGESQSNGNRLNGDLFGNYTKNFGDFSLKAVAGLNVQVRTSKAIGVSTTGIGVPGLYNLSNSSTGLYSGNNSESTQRKLGGYGDLTLGLKGFLYLEGTVRRDYTSLFYNTSTGFNSPAFTTYGGALSFILTDAVPSIKGNILDNVKVRAAYNNNANDINVGTYSLATTYPNASGYPYSGLLGTTVGNTIISPNLKPEVVKTAEVGIDLGFYNNRFTLEASYYRTKASNQILNVNISSASGASSYLLNAAEVTTKGLELNLSAIVLKTKNFNFSANVNYSYNTNVVDELYAGTGLTNLEYQAPDALASLNATKGLMFPSLRTTVYQRDPQGRVIVDPSDGWPLRAETRLAMGNTLPKHDLGIGLNLGYKNFTLIANAEYRGGYVIYNDIGTDMTFTGSGALTTVYNRDQFIWPNSVYMDGTGKYVQNTNIAVDQFKALYQGFGDQGFTRGFAGIGEMYIASGAFWKLRDVSLTYDLPRSFISKLKTIKDISFSAWGRNLITLLPADNIYTDPEFANTNGNSTGINTTLNTPPTLQIGGTVRVVF
jgi:TonB-linked SusC/RagA family outer membrane protein